MFHGKPPHLNRFPVYFFHIPSALPDLIPSENSKKVQQIFHPLQT